MSEVSKHLVYLGLEVAGLLVVLASIDGMITLLKMLVGRTQRRRDHAAFVQRFRGSVGADPWDYADPPREADQIVIEARKGLK